MAAKSSGYGRPSSGGSRGGHKKKVEDGAIFDRLTDTAKFTGAHKERFDKCGRGKGKAGRTQEGETIGDISQIVGADRGAPKSPGRGHMSGASVPKSPRGAASSPGKGKKKVGDGAIFDRLTDTSKFTGAHKERFDKSGRGKGKAGQTHEGDTVSDISDILGAEKSVGRTLAGGSAQKLASPQRGSSGRSQGDAIFDRLTDSSGYTGAVSTSAPPAKTRHAGMFFLKGVFVGAAQGAVWKRWHWQRKGGSDAAR